MSEPLPSEHDEQRFVVNYLTHHYPHIKLAAIPNAGKRSGRAGATFKREGMSPGFPDLMIPALMLYVEMKRQKGAKSVVSKEQKDWIAYLNTLPGQKAVVAYGAKDAIEQIENRMKELNLL